MFVSDIAEHPLATSVFAQLRASQPHTMLMLDTTYRLNEALSRVIGRTFYPAGDESGIRSSPEARVRRFPSGPAAEARSDAVYQALSSEHALVWLRTPESSHTQYNPVEASVVAEIVCACLRGGLTEDQVAVVTPFRRQAMRIRGLLSTALGPEAPLPIVDTVERVQGLTVEVIVVSLSASDRDYTASIAGFLLSRNRLNVAISRARTKAIVVASPTALGVVPVNYDALLARNTWRELIGSAHAIDVA